jgi:hypothetical protein
MHTILGATRFSQLAHTWHLKTPCEAGYSTDFYTSLIHCRNFNQNRRTNETISKMRSHVLQLDLLIDPDEKDERP